MHSSKDSLKQSPKKMIPQEKDLKQSGELSKSLEVLHLSESSVSERGSTSTLEVFRVMYYMKHFRATDMSIKLVDRTVFIDARHDEHVDEHGFVSRFFVKTVNLPENANEEELVVTFNADGILSLFAPLQDTEDPDSGVGESKSKEESESRDDSEPKSESESKDFSESKGESEIKNGSDSRDDGDTNASDLMDVEVSKSGSDSNISPIPALENKEAI